MAGNSAYSDVPARWRAPIALLWLCCWAAVLYVGLWPLDFHPVNGVRWPTDGQGIQFKQRGLAYWPEGIAGILRELNVDGGRFTMELVLRPASQEKEKPHVGILFENASRDRRSRLVLEQYGTMLILTESRGSGNGFIRKKAGVANALRAGQQVHVAITADESENRLYVNGVAADRLPNIVDTRQLEGPLVLGNSGRTGSPWEGDVLRIAIYGSVRNSDQILADARAPGPPTQSSEAVSYDFAERSGSVSHGRPNGDIPLYIPGRLPLFDRCLLPWDFRADWSGISDVLINILGFIPFGFLGTATLVSRTSIKRSACYMFAIGFLLSLFIEVVQSYLPFRSSSSTDLLMNTVGTLAGVGLFAWTRNWISKLGSGVQSTPHL